MIVVHRLGHESDAPIYLNSDLIVTVEKTPDTIVTLATGHKVVVHESPEEILSAVFGWRVSVAAGALQESPPVSPRGGPPTGGDDPTVRPLRPVGLKVHDSAADK